MNLLFGKAEKNLVVSVVTMGEHMRGTASPVGQQRHVICCSGR